MAGARCHCWPRQEFNVVINQGFRIKSQILRIGRNHLQSFHARWHAGHVAEFNSLNMVGVNARGLTGIFQGFTTLFALALQKPARFARWIAGTIGLLAKTGLCLIKIRFFPAKLKLWIVHGLTLSCYQH